MGTGNWGSAFFGKKENYYIIPNKVKVMFGDNYLLKNNLDNNKINYFIKNLKCHHSTSSTSSSNDFNDICTKDFDFAEKYFVQDRLLEVHFELEP